MGTWQGLPIGPKTGRLQHSERPRHVVGCSIVLVLAAVLAFLGFLATMSRGGGVGEPATTPVPTPRPAVAAAPTSSPTVAATVTTLTTASLPPRPVSLVVANTEGQGVFIRRNPSATDKIRAWPERTVMILIGEDRQAEGRRWRNVRDPAGNEGWVPADYLVSPPTPTATPNPSRHP